MGAPQSTPGAEYSDRDVIVESGAPSELVRAAELVRQIQMDEIGIRMYYLY